MAITNEAGSGGGGTSIAIWAIVSVVLMGWVAVTLYSGRHHVASSTTQSDAQSPAAPDSKSP